MGVEELGLLHTEIVDKQSLRLYFLHPPESPEAEKAVEYDLLSVGHIEPHAFTGALPYETFGSTLDITTRVDAATTDQALRKRFEHLAVNAARVKAVRIYDIANNLAGDNLVFLLGTAKQHGKMPLEKDLSKIEEVSGVSNVRLGFEPGNPDSQEGVASNKVLRVTLELPDVVGAEVVNRHFQGRARAVAEKSRLLLPVSPSRLGFTTRRTEYLVSTPRRGS